MAYQGYDDDPLADVEEALARRRTNRWIFFCCFIVLAGCIGTALWLRDKRLGLYAVYSGNTNFHAGDGVQWRVEAFDARTRQPIKEFALKIEVVDPAAPKGSASPVIYSGGSNKESPYALPHFTLPPGLGAGKRLLRATVTASQGTDVTSIPIDIVPAGEGLRRAVVSEIEPEEDRVKPADPTDVSFGGDDTVRVMLIPNNGRLAPELTQEVLVWAFRDGGMPVADLVFEIEAPGRDTPLTAVTDAIGLGRFEYAPRAGGEDVKVTVSKGPKGLGNTWHAKTREREAAIEAVRGRPDDERRKAFAIKPPELRRGASPQTFRWSFTPVGGRVRVTPPVYAAKLKSQFTYEMERLNPAQPVELNIFAAGDWVRSVVLTPTQPTVLLTEPLDFSARGFLQFQFAEPGGRVGRFFDAFAVYVPKEGLDPANTKELLKYWFGLFRAEGAGPLRELLGEQAVDRWWRWVDQTTHGVKYDEKVDTPRMLALLARLVPKRWFVVPPIVNTLDGLSKRPDMRGRPVPPGLTADDPSWIGHNAAFVRRMNEIKRILLYVLIANAVLLGLVILWRIVSTTARQAKAREVAGLSDEELQATAGAPGNVRGLFVALLFTAAFYGALIWFVLHVHWNVESGWKL